jgi:hypothetical protein
MLIIEFKMKKKFAHYSCDISDTNFSYWDVDR